MAIKHSKLKKITYGSKYVVWWRFSRLWINVEDTNYMHTLGFVHSYLFWAQVVIFVWYYYISSVTLNPIRRNYQIQCMDFYSFIFVPCWLFCAELSEWVGGEPRWANIEEKWNNQTQPRKITHLNLHLSSFPFDWSKKVQVYLLAQLCIV